MKVDLCCNYKIDRYISYFRPLSCDIKITISLYTYYNQNPCFVGQITRDIKTGSPTDPQINYS